MSYNREYRLPHIPLYYSVPLLLVSICAMLILLFVFNIEYPQILLQPIPPNAINVSSCGILSQSNAYYVLNMSLNFSSVGCLNVTGSNVILDGQHRYLITGQNIGDPFNQFGAAAVSVLGNSVTLFRLNITNSHSAIEILGNYTTVDSNTISGSNHTGILLQHSNGARISRNTIHNSDHGMIVRYTANSTFSENVIQGREVTGSGNSSIGFYFVSSSRNSLGDNFVNMTAYGTYLISSNDNNFTNHHMNSPVINGIYSLQSTRNLYNGARITNSGQHAITISSSANEAITLDNVRVSGTRANYHDLEVDHLFGFSGAIFVDLIDTNLASYRLNRTLVTFTNRTNSKIAFRDPINVSGSNLANDVRLGFNFVDVNSASRRELNRSATVTFEGLPTNFINATIFRNGVPCPLTVCINTTSLNAGMVIFNVSSWTNYSIGSGDYTIPPTIDIEEPDQNETYTPSNFPVIFDVDLSHNGSVAFSLNNGVTNTTMNTINNLSFTYNQSLLSFGNYTMVVYANFTNSPAQNASVNFRVVNTTTSNQNNNSNNNAPGPTGTTTNNNTLPFPNSSTTPRTSNATITVPPRTGQAITLKVIVYWLLVAVISIMIVVLSLLIIRALQDRTLVKKNPGMSSQLR